MGATSRAADAREVEGVRSAVRFVVDGHRRALAFMASTAFLGGVLEALFLITVTRAAFAITNDDDRVGIVAGWYLSIGAALALALVLIVLRVALAASASWQSARLSSTVVAHLRRRLASAFFDASWSVQQAQRSGSLQELMSTYSGQASALMNALAQGVVSAANLLALLGLAIAVDPLGALVLVVSVGVLGSLLRPLRAAVRRRGRRAAAAGMELATAVSEASELGMELHVFNVQDEAKARTDVLIGHAQERTRRLQFASGLATPAYVGMAYLALVGALAFVAASSSTSLTSLGAALLVMLRSLSYGQSLQGAYIILSSSTPSIEELSRRLDVLDAGRRERAGEPVGRIGVLEADRVSFSYDDENEVLHDVSFTVTPQEIVGIVGPSGGGKSTLVQLLLGLRDPQGGRILASGRDIRRFDRAEWARRITFVPQEAHLITGTIAENIRFLRDDVTGDDVERAARLAHLHDDVVALAGGYDRILGEGGARLSGGQQQRLCIARALVEQPDVLILDEPTSALDVRSEHLVRSTLLGLKERMTVIVIAHRLSTLDICDRIMVIQDGRLVGFDTPSELETTNDFYREALVLSGLR
jgi:ATP-binding cassette, subfamily B, bacterial